MTASAAAALLPNKYRLLSLRLAHKSLAAHAAMQNMFFPSVLDTRALFSYTENNVEVSIIAEESVAARDFGGIPDIYMVDERFRAVQIDSDFGPENGGRRICEITAPLAEAGISIFYLSTYHTDYIFVKERRLPVVVQTLRSHGFHVDDDDDDGLSASDGGAQHQQRQYYHRPRTHAHTESSGSDTTGLVSLTSLSMSPSPPPPGSIVTGGISTDGTEATATVPVDIPLTNDVSSITPLGPSRETSPSKRPPVAVDSDLLMSVRRACKLDVASSVRLRLVGLSRDYFTTWGLPVMQLLFFSQQLTPAAATTNGLGSETPSPQRFISYTRAEDGISLVADQAALMQLPEYSIQTDWTPQQELRVVQVDLSHFGLDRYGIVWSIADPLANAGINLLYLSTVRTANILVSEDDVGHTLRLIESSGKIGGSVNA
ncbi:hypothetical protein RI367_008188 [Sorochytrium milnesiophthora]